MRTSVHLYINVYSSFICSSQKLRRSQCPSKGEWINYGTACLEHYTAAKGIKLLTCSNVNKPPSPHPQIIYTVCIFHTNKQSYKQSQVSKSKSVGVWRLGEYVEEGRKEVQQWSSRKLLIVMDMFISLDCANGSTGVYVYQNKSKCAL